MPNFISNYHYQDETTSALNCLASENQLNLSTVEFASFMDQNDPLKSFRKKFHIPKKRSFKETDGSLVGDLDEDCIYLCGNSLGLQPKQTESNVQAQLTKWAQIGVATHFEPPLPAASCDDYGRESLGHLVGAAPKNVVLMNGLTVNLHLLLISFYQPTQKRHKILIEKGAFPSDRYAVRSQAEMRGFGPESVIEVGPKIGEHIIRTEDILQVIDQEGENISVICLSGVQYYTGQKFDMEEITRAGHSKGCYVGWDLAHAIGNVKISLDNWDVDFACWCTYKYLNSGAGCIAGAFVNKKHEGREAAHLVGWWSNRSETRFTMSEDCDLSKGVDGFKLCNPSPILVSCVLSSLEIFNEAGMNEILKKQMLLTGYLEHLMDNFCSEFEVPPFTIITPRSPSERGCQLSLLFCIDLKSVHKELKKRAVICDIRLPNAMRIAPTPLYNTFNDVYEFVNILRTVLKN